MSNIKKNAAAIYSEISATAIKSGRSPYEIQLIGVTKTIDHERIRQLIAAGVTILGESRVQEFLPKYEYLRESRPTWHFIGHLQRNKVKFIIDKVTMIHSVDSIALAQEIDKRAGGAGIIMDILVEINIAEEDSKHGIAPSQAHALVEELAKLCNVRVKGLMCLAPYVDNPEDNRHYFTKMRNLLHEINEGHAYGHSLTELSMGMSGDYAIAIEEGATIVRIGTALVS